jgi:hypothetical protein
MTYDVKTSTRTSVFNSLPTPGVDFDGVVHGVTYRPSVPDTLLEGSFEEALETPAMPVRSPPSRS